MIRLFSSAWDVELDIPVSEIYSVIEQLEAQEFGLA